MTIKRVLIDSINNQTRHLDVLIIGLHELHIRKTFNTVETRSNLQLADVNSKPRGGKSLKDLIDQSIGVEVYSPPGSEQ